MFNATKIAEMLGVRHARQLLHAGEESRELTPATIPYADREMLEEDLADEEHPLGDLLDAWCSGFNEEAATMGVLVDEVETPA